MNNFLKVLVCFLLFGLLGLLVSGTRKTALNIGKVHGCRSAVLVSPILNTVTKDCIIENERLTLHFVDDSKLDIDK